MDKFYVGRAYKQGGSVVIVIPKPVCRALRIKSRDFIVLSMDPGNDFVKVSKWKPRSKEDGKDS